MVLSKPGGPVLLHSIVYNGQMKKCTFSKSGCKDMKFAGAMTGLRACRDDKTEIIRYSIVSTGLAAVKEQNEAETLFLPRNYKNSD